MSWPLVGKSYQQIANDRSNKVNYIYDLLSFGLWVEYIWKLEYEVG